MAQFSYEQFAQSQTNRSPRNTEQAERKQVKFFTLADGDSAVVRFPYANLNEVVMGSVHQQIDYPKFGGGTRKASINCTGDGSCPFCQQNVKLANRAFINMVVYNVDPQTNSVVLEAAVWDRPAMFVQIELKEKMEEYGDLRNVLFKVKRTGTGTSTRYTINPIINAAVYDPNVYVADFSCLEGINPMAMLTKTVDQYNEAWKKNDEAPAAQAAPTAATYQPAPQQAKVDDAPWTAPQAAPAPAAAPNTFRAPATAPAPQAAPAAAPSAPGRRFTL